MLPIGGIFFLFSHKKVRTSAFVFSYYFVDLQNDLIRTSQKSRDIAFWWASHLLTKVFLLYFCNDAHGTGVYEIHPETVIAGLTRKSKIRRSQSPERKGYFFALRRWRMSLRHDGKGKRQCDPFNSPA